MDLRRSPERRHIIGHGPRDVERAELLPSLHAALQQLLVVGEDGPDGEPAVCCRGHGGHHRQALKQRVLYHKVSLLYLAFHLNANIEIFVLDLCPTVKLCKYALIYSCLVNNIVDDSAITLLLH